MAVRQVLALALVCGALEPTIACSRCFEFCDSGIQIDLLPPLAAGRFANGAYRLTWVSDDDTGTCEFEVADDDRCDEGATVCVLTPSCADAFGGDGGKVHMFFDQTPESLQITLERDGEVISDTEHEPAYKETAQERRRCGPPCREATISIPVGP